VVGGFVSADTILPARWSFVPPSEMAEHVLEELSPDTNNKIRSRPIIIAGEAFGYGTGRESPARAIRAAGIKAIVGGPFARMFFRNAINNGVLVLDCANLANAGVADGDELTIDIDRGVIFWNGCSFEIAPPPDVIRNIVAAGSLIDYGRKLLAQTGTKQ
jgi:3-isopropylmalate/(R)-2-methylmalate dehydratase small subunit